MTCADLAEVLIVRPDIVCLGCSSDEEDYVICGAPRPYCIRKATRPGNERICFCVYTTPRNTWVRPCSVEVAAPNKTVATTHAFRITRVHSAKERCFDKLDLVSSA